MRTRGRGALGGALAAWLLVSGCGDRAAPAARVDAALQRDLRLATATTVSLATPAAPAARFLPAADEAPHVAPERRVRPVRRVGARAHAAQVPVVAVAPVVEPLAPTPEPVPERMQRYAAEEGASSMLVGVVLRGGAVGDDHCERALPHARPAPATLGYRATTVRLGGVPAGPRSPGAVPFAPPF
ncbi:hypothetical protein [Roseisolibacter agri]|nr:hypothetical protein [Roseisolibacter agri]